MDFKLLIVCVILGLLGVVSESKSLNRVKRVIKGNTKSIEDIPYQVALVSDNFPICGGTILSEEAIITAAHCACSYGQEQVLVYAGMTSKRKLHELKGIKIKSIKIHEQYNYTGEATPDDVALLFLEEKLQFGPRIQKIDLVTEDYEVPLIATVSGWGSTNCNFSLSNDDACNGWYATELQAGNITITRKENGLIYAPSTEVTGNYGDSGGPVVANNKLIGVTRNCDIVKPNVFDFDATSVLDYLPWITESLSAAYTDENFHANLHRLVTIGNETVKQPLCTYGLD